MVDEEHKIQVPTSTDVSQDTLDRGQWNTFQLDQLNELRQYMRAQNPCVMYVYDSNAGIAAGDIIPIHTSLGPALEHGGWIPLRNGFFAGMSIIIETPTSLTAVQGMVVRVYRNHVISTASMLITGEHNTLDELGAAAGIIKTHEYNTNPSGRIPRVEQDVHEFKAGELIELECEAPANTTITIPANTIKELHVFLYYVFDATNSETLAARRFGGGLPGGGGGGSDTGGEIIVV